VSAMRCCALPNKPIVRCARYAAAYAGWGSNRAQRRAFLALPRPLPGVCSAAGSVGLGTSHRTRTRRLSAAVLAALELPLTLTRANCRVPESPWVARSPENPRPLKAYRGRVTARTRCLLLSRCS
jgi:hypothetical protein